MLLIANCMHAIPLIIVLCSLGVCVRGSDANPVGTILAFAGVQPPSGWFVCDGRWLNKMEHPELYNVIGDAFSQEVSDSLFRLPDLRGRTLVGAGQGSIGGALTERSFGSYLGTEKHTLTVGEMPAHDHAINDPGHRHQIQGSHNYQCGSDCWAVNSAAATDPGTAATITSSSGGQISVKSAGYSQPHENMQPSAVVSFIIKAGAYTPLVTQSTTIVLPVVTPWPQPEHLLGFWPLDKHYSLHDISQNRFNGDPQVKTKSVTGPFGDPDTAQSPEADKVLEVTNTKLSIKSFSFTVAFFLRRGSASQAEGGIFEFNDKFGTPNAFQLRYITKTTVEISANDNLVGKYAILQQSDVWTFIAMVFNGSTSMFSIYGKHGVVAPPSFQAHIFASNSFNNNGVRLGYASRWNQGLQTSDAVSCLMIYSTALSALEIRQAHDACRIIHGSAPCGSPKLPLVPIPSATSVTTTPKPGQFPYIASVRFGSRHICSASIIDEHWLLTSATCFVETRNASFYTVYVGQHDLNTNEPHVRKHSVAKVIIPDNKANRDVALIELREPIDFTNPYVNDACFFRSGKVAEVKFDETQFVFGWGKNGRSPMISESLCRYIPGLLLTDSQCKQAWGQANYIPSKDFCFLSASTDKNAPCTGDEGSPLLLQAPANQRTGLGDRLVQIGVYYKRAANCTVLKPPLFTNVAQYSTWLAEKIACAIPGILYPATCPQD